MGNCEVDNEPTTGVCRLQKGAMPRLKIQGDQPGERRKWVVWTVCSVSASTDIACAWLSSGVLIYQGWGRQSGLPPLRGR
jgi:hypothetical protein